MPLPAFSSYENPFQTKPLSGAEINKAFEGKPEEAFFSVMPEGLTRGAEAQYRNLLRPFLADLITSVGRRIQQGALPTAQEAEFARNYPRQERLAAMSPSEKGLGVARFNPFARWQF